MDNNIDIIIFDHKYYEIFDHIMTIRRIGRHVQSSQNVCVLKKKYIYQKMKSISMSVLKISY